MQKSNCKHCKKGMVFNLECESFVIDYYCDIAAYDEERGCTHCPYKKKKEKKAR